MVMNALSMMALAALLYIECSPQYDTDKWLRKIAIFTCMIVLAVKG